MKWSSLNEEAMLLVRHILFVLLVTCLAYGAPQSEVSVPETCVLTLTIPKDSIKSSCNMNEQLLRKMQSMESQFNHYRTQVGALKIRLPEIVLNLNSYHNKVEQLELVIAKESTFYKHMDDRLKALEESSTKDAENEAKKPLSEPDTLLDPIRPYVMAELQQMKEDLRKELLQEKAIKKKEAKEKTKEVTDEKLTSVIKPLILAEMQYVKDEILKSVKNMMSVKILDQNEEIGSSDEIRDHISEETVQTGNQQPDMVADQGVTKEQSFQTMARILHSFEENNVTIITNENDADTLQNVTKQIDVVSSENNSLPENPPVLMENLKKTIEILQNAAQNNLAKDLNDRIDAVSLELTAVLDKTVTELDSKISTVEEKANILDEKLQDMFVNFTSRLQELDTLVQKLNISENINKVNNSVLQIKTNIQAMDRRIDSYMNDVALDSKIQSKLENIKSNFDMSLMGIQSSVTSFENKISKLERQGNLSSTLMNHFKKTIVHNHNETNVNFENVKSEISELEKRLKDEMIVKTNTDDLKDKLEGMTMDFMFFRGTVKDLKNSSTAGYRELGVKFSELKKKTQSISWQLTSLEHHAQRIEEIERNQTLMKNNHDLMQEVMKLVHLEQKLRHNRWIEFNFTQHSVNNGCNKKQLVKKNPISKDGIGAYVGVQLCSQTRYKIFLGNSLDEEFLDIGDIYGHGQDHCQFIGGESENDVKVDTEFPAAMGMKAFLRRQWNEKPHLGFLSFMTPTPRWYECGKSLP